MRKPSTPCAAETQDRLPQPHFHLCSDLQLAEHAQNPSPLCLPGRRQTAYASRGSSQATKTRTLKLLPQKLSTCETSGLGLRKIGVVLVVIRNREPPDLQTTRHQLSLRDRVERWRVPGRSGVRAVWGYGHLKLGPRGGTKTEQYCSLRARDFGSDQRSGSSPHGVEFGNAKQDDALKVVDGGAILGSGRSRAR